MAVESQLSGLKDSVGKVIVQFAAGEFAHARLMGAHRDDHSGGIRCRSALTISMKRSVANSVREADASTDEID